MVKRIIIICAVYAIFIAVLTKTITVVDNSFIILLLIGSFAFITLLLREIWKKYFIGFKPANQVISYGNSTSPALEEWKQISKKPFLFGLENKMVSEDEFFFDQENFYAVNQHSQKAIYKLSDIIEVSKTSIQINNRSIWQVRIKQHNGEALVFKFAHNYTLWNKNFHLFYSKIAQINPSAIKSAWSMWTM